jgi:vacuolar protein sorting-associated protein 13A/C
VHQEPDDQLGFSREDRTYTLHPRTTMEYAWDFPAVRDKKLILGINGSDRIVDIMEIGNLVPFKFYVIVCFFVRLVSF